MGKNKLLPIPTTFPLYFLNRVILFCLLLTTILEVNGQHFIQLTHQRSGRARFFMIGDRVVLNQKDPTLKPERGRIQTILDSGLWVNDHFVHFDSLTYLGEGGLWGRFAWGTASALTGAYLITHLPSEGQIGLGQYLAGQILAGTGILQFFISGIKLLTSTHYDLEKKWVLQVRKFRLEPDYP